MICQHAAILKLASYGGGPSNYTIKPYSKNDDFNSTKSNCTDSSPLSHGVIDTHDKSGFVKIERSSPINTMLNNPESSPLSANQYTNNSSNRNQQQQSTQQISNCQDCGALIFGVSYHFEAYYIYHTYFAQTIVNKCLSVFAQNGAVKAIKDEKYNFYSDVSPYEMLLNNFKDEQNYEIVCNLEALEYLKERQEMVQQIFEMGKRYKQREEVVHMAIELLDRFYMSQEARNFEYSPKNKALYVLTLFLIASKSEELDENIPLIKDLIRYFCRTLPTSVPTPTFNDIVECERNLMNHFKWDLMFVTPTVFIQAFLANGIIFDNEDIEQAKIQDIVKNIHIRVKDNLHALVQDLHLFRDKKSSHLACVIIYLARKEEFQLLQNQPDSWIYELQFITNYSELDLLEPAEKLRKCILDQAERAKSENKIENTCSKTNKENQVTALKPTFQVKNSPSRQQSQNNARKSMSPFRNKSNIQNESRFQQNTNQGSSNYQQNDKSTLQDQNNDYAGKQGGNSSNANQSFSQPAFMRSSTQQYMVQRSNYANQYYEKQQQQQKSSNQQNATDSQRENQGGSFIADQTIEEKDKFIPLRTKQAQTMKSIQPNQSQSNHTNATSSRADESSLSNISKERQFGGNVHAQNGNSRQYMNESQSVNISREYEARNRLQSSQQQQQINKENTKGGCVGSSSSYAAGGLSSTSHINSSSYSRMPALGTNSRDNTHSHHDYSTQQVPNNGSIHTTRIPPQMRAGLTHKASASSGYDYHHQNNRESSNSKLPQIDVSFKNYQGFLPQSQTTHYYNLKYPQTSTNSGSGSQEQLTLAGSSHNNNYPSVSQSTTSNNIASHVNNHQNHTIHHNHHDYNAKRSRSWKRNENEFSTSTYNHSHATGHSRDNATTASLRPPLRKEMSRAIAGAYPNRDQNHGVTSNSRTRLVGGATGIYHSNRNHTNNNNTTKSINTSSAYENVNNISHSRHHHDASLSINHYANNSSNIFSRENLHNQSSNNRESSLGKTGGASSAFGAHRASLMQVNPVNLRQF